MITNVREFVKYTFIHLFQPAFEGVPAVVVTHGHKLERRFGNHESRIISIDGGPWMESSAAQRKFERIIRADRKAEMGA